MISELALMYSNQCLMVLSSSSTKSVFLTPVVRGGLVGDELVSSRDGFVGDDSGSAHTTSVFWIPYYSFNFQVKEKMPKPVESTLICGVLTTKKVLTCYMIHLLGLGKKP